MRSVVDTAWRQLSDRPLADAEPSAHLGEMLEGHRKWVESNGAEGKSADLSGMDLRERFALDQAPST